MWKSPWFPMVLGALLLAISLVAAVWAPGAFDWDFVFSGAFAVTIGLIELAEAKRKCAD